MGIVLAILVFSFIIFAHELGHFLLAKANKIRVDEFSIGMGPRIISWVRGETRYSWKLFPIGGSCMMGEDDADDMSEGSFNSKSVWARISVVAAGAIFNFILAWLFATIIVGMGGYIEPVIGEVPENGGAYEAGLRAGDEITHINGKRVYIWQEISYNNMLHPGEEAVVTYERDGKEYEVTVTPKKAEDGAYYMGITSGKLQDANVLTAMQYGVYEVRFWINLTIESLKMLITGGASMNDLSGPVGIVDAYSKGNEQAEEAGGIVGQIQFGLNFGVLLSANLGVMNLLPLPALDGGRLVFLFIEAIRRKRVPPNKEGWVHAAGMVLLLALMAFVMFNDIRKLF